MDDYDALREMIEEFQQEAADMESRIRLNIRNIREAEAYLKVYLDSEPDDVKVFSPRKMEILYQEEIRKKKEEKSVWEKENQELSSRKAILDSRIASLKGILGRQQQDFSSRPKEVKEQYGAAIRELNGLADRMEKGSASMERNLIQARQEFAIIERRLREIVYDMGHMIGWE